MAKKVKLSVVVPCFNEEKRLPQRFPAAYKYFRKNVPDFEMILINDGSADRSAEILKKIAQNYPRVKIISYAKNQGKGYALKQGVKQSVGEIVAFMDADFAISVSESSKFIREIEKGADVVVGNRRDSASEKLNSAGALRLVLGKALALLNNVFLDIGGIKDSQCGFKFFRGEVARELFGQLTISRWLFDLELLMLAREQRLKIARLPVAWEQTSESKVNIGDDLWPVTKDLMKTYLRFYNVKLHAFILLAVLVLLMAPFLINPHSLTSRNGDFSDLVMPDYYLFKDSVWRFHQIPLWNPTLFSGVPEIANPQSPIIYPPNYLSLILPVDLTIVLLVVFHAFVAGIFLFLLARELGWSRLSAVATSFVYTFSPFFWGKVAVGHLSQSFAIFLVPPILYFGACLLRGFKRKDFLFLLLFLSLQYLNYPTLWYFTVLFGGFCFGWISLAKKQYIQLIVVPLAAGLSLVLILPIFLAQLTAGPLITRSSLSFSDLAIPLWNLKRFLVSVVVPSNLVGDSETEVWLYPSLAAAALALLGWRKLSRTYKGASLVVIIGVVLITLGDRTPLFGLLTAYFPGFSYLRVATRDWFVLVAVISILAGWGLNKITGRWRNILAGLIFVDLLVFSAWRLWSVPKIMTQRINGQLEQFLNQDNSFRYYCTSRCLSALYTFPRGISTADGYHLIILKTYREAISRAGGFPPPKYTGNIPSVDDTAAQPSAKELGSFAVKWVVSDHSLSDSNFAKMDHVEGFTLYKNLAALPRFRFLENPAQAVNVLTESPNYLKLQTGGLGGDLFLADSFYPGWEAKIDSKPAIVYVEDGWARAVLVPPGNHLVELEFKPFNHLTEK